MKDFWGVRGLPGDSFNLTLTLKVMSREDPRLGQHRDLDFKKMGGIRGNQANQPEKQNKRTLVMKEAHFYFHVSASLQPCSHSSHLVTASHLLNEHHTHPLDNRQIPVPRSTVISDGNAEGRKAI